MDKAARVDIIDRSVEKANIWFAQVAEALGTDDRGYAYRVLRGFLHTLRDRLTIEEAAELAAQLPALIRGVFYEGWVPSRTPAGYRDPETFLDQLAKEAILHSSTEASYAAAAAAGVLRRHLSEGEFEDVMNMLPAEVRKLLEQGDG